jgi:hypothetical protein
MNERINQLAEQAFNEANNGSINNIKIPKEFVEKFAELIVRECAEHIDFAIFSNGGIDGRSLKEHFGVEE